MLDTIIALPCRIVLTVVVKMVTCRVEISRKTDLKNLLFQLRRS